MEITTLVVRHKYQRHFNGSHPNHALVNICFAEGGITGGEIFEYLFKFLKII
jgi:hypothetical protein